MFAFHGLWERPRCCSLPRTRTLVALLTYSVVLEKPLGILFAEDADITGLAVAEIINGGTAQAIGSIWQGDRLVRIGDHNVSTGAFEEIMGALVSATSPVRLHFHRRGDVAKLTMPDGSVAFGPPGDPLAPLALHAGYKVTYDCEAGHCGVCELVLENDQAMRRVRMCRAKLPPGDSKLSRPDETSPTAEAEAKMQLLQAQLRAEGNVRDLDRRVFKARWTNPFDRRR